MSVFNEVLEWQEHADHARQVAAHLTNPEAKQAMLQAAKGLRAPSKGYRRQGAETRLHVRNSLRGEAHLINGAT